MSDEELSGLSWKYFTARNQSIIVDLMYGQLKSTVRCLTCENISITFDPFITVPLPLRKVSYATFSWVPYDVYRERTKADGESSESDDDFKQGKYVAVEHPTFKLKTAPGTTIFDLKKMVIDNV